jgi:uncharacterized membrane protein
MSKIGSKSLFTRIAAALVAATLSFGLAAPAHADGNKREVGKKRCSAIYKDKKLERYTKTDTTTIAGLPKITISCIYEGGEVDAQFFLCRANEMQTDEDMQDLDGGKAKMVTVYCQPK